jgi:hypothetical protein
MRRSIGSITRTSDSAVTGVCRPPLPMEGAASHFQAQLLSREIVRLPIVEYEVQEIRLGIGVHLKLDKCIGSRAKVFGYGEKFVCCHELRGKHIAVPRRQLKFRAACNQGHY